MANTLRFKRGLVAGIPTGVAGEPLFTTDTFDLYIGNGTTNTRFQQYIASGTTAQYLRGDGSLATFPTNIVTGTGTTNYLPKFTGASTLGNSVIFDNGTNVGIGTASINGKLQVKSSTNQNLVIGTQGGELSFEVVNDAYSVNTPIRYYASTHNWYTAGNIKATLDTSGNLGLGVTPSAWSTGQAAIQGSGWAITQTGVNNTYYIQNANFNGTNWIYRNSFAASFYLQSAGSHQWYQAPSGTAGNTISWTIPMTLTANGRLLLGTTTEGTQRLQVAGDVKFDADAATNGFYWDNTNKRLGIGTNVPKARVHTLLNGNAANGITGTTIIGQNSSSGSNSYLTLIGAFDAEAGIAFTDESEGYRGRIVYSNNNEFMSFWTDLAERMRITSGGSVGIGTTSLTGVSLSVSKNITGAVASIGIVQAGQVQTDVTSVATGFRNVLNTAASTPLGDYYHIRLGQGTIGAGTTLTQQIGLYINDFAYGTSRYGILSELSAGTGKWNLYCGGTADNYLAGNLAVGTTTTTNKLEVWGSGNTAARVAALSAGTATLILASGGVTAYSIKSGNGDSSLRIDQDGTDRVTIASGGSVGIGTTSPTAPLTFGKAVYAAPSSEDFYRIKIQDNGGINNDVGIGQTVSGNLSFNVGANGSVSFFEGTNGERMRLWGTTGNLAVGGAFASDSGEKLQVNGTMKVTGNTTFDVSGGTTGMYWESVNKRLSIGANSAEGKLDIVGDNNQLFIKTTGTYASLYFKVNANSRAALYATDTTTFLEGRGSSGLILGGATSATHLTISSTGAATFSSSGQFGGQITGASGGTEGKFNFLGYNGAYGGILSNTGYSSSYNNVYLYSNFNAARNGQGNSALPTYTLELGGATPNNDSFTIQRSPAGSFTFSNLFKVDGTGAATFSSSIEAATAIAIGTTPDTNKPFKILKNINATVGINFENTSTGASAFSAIQMGTDVTGGTAFTNLVYGSSGISEAGVYKPSGTSLVNTGAGGLNFLAVSQPIRFFTSSGNGTLRASITNDGDYTQFNGTNPSASTTDAFRMYSADVVAGNAAPHFRTENGAVIKLYQETTAVGNSTISVGGGSAVLDDTQFGGYTLRQVVKALQNQGILA